MHGSPAGLRTFLTPPGDHDADGGDDKNRAKEDEAVEPGEDVRAHRIHLCVRRWDNEGARHPTMRACVAERGDLAIAGRIVPTVFFFCLGQLALSGGRARGHACIVNICNLHVRTELESL